MARARHRKAAALSVSAALAACACIMHMSACDDAGAHLYVGRPYDEAHDCVGATTSIDVVDGRDDPGACPVMCLVQSSGPDGARSVYVAGMCPPLPFGIDTSGTDPACPKALAANDRKDFCNPDGGPSSNPAADASADATADAEAPPADAGADAPADAASE